MRRSFVKKVTVLVLIVVMLILLPACFNRHNSEYGNSADNSPANKPEETNNAQKKFNDLMQDIFVYDVSDDIYTLFTKVKEPASFNIEVSDDISCDAFKLKYTDDEINLKKETVNEFVLRLEAISYNELSDYQQLVYDKMAAEFELAEESFELNDLFSPLAVNNGWVSNVQVAMYEYIFDNEEDIANYQKLLETMPGIMETIPDYVQMQIDEYGLFPSDYMVENTVNTLINLQKAEDNPFIDGYNSKIDEMSLDEIKAEEYKTANEKYVKEVLIPAFAALQSEVEAFKGSTDEPIGVYHTVGGEDYYNYLIKSYGFDMDSNEMFEYLYDKFYVVYEAQMKIAAMDYNAVMDYYNRDYELNIPEEPDAMMKQLIDEFSGEFPVVKNAGYKLSYLPKSLEIEGVLAYCVINRLDDTDAATCIRVNVAQIAGDAKTLYTTLAHEGYPGHMLHSNYYNNSIQYPEEGMLSYLGYIEGWARYVDNKACYKMGTDSKIADLSQIDSDLNYTLCGLLDVAINGLGYDAEEVSKLMEDLYGGKDLETARTMVERFSADPGLYLPYSAGYWCTVDLLDEYKEVCGDSMSHSEIYERYMSFGPAPFSVLRKYLLSGACEKISVN